MDNWFSNNIGDATRISKSTLPATGQVLDLLDPLMGKLTIAKKALQTALESSIEGENEQRSLIEFLLASCEGDLVTLESLIRVKPDLINQKFPDAENGVGCLVYAICFNNFDLIESLLNNPETDPDLFDTIVYYTPLMWAVYFNQLETVKLLLNCQANPYLEPKNDGKNAISMITPDKPELYKYFRSHNMLNITKPLDGDFYRADFETPDPLVDDLATQIKLQSITSEHYQEEEKLEAYDEERELASDPTLVMLKTFEYDKLLPEQYLKFSDSDIPIILDYIFNLRNIKTSYQYESKIPATVIFQLIRYSSEKVDSRELTEYLFEFFTARLRSVTNTKSGVFNMATTDNATSAGGSGDIVLLSYWLAAVQFLHFYFSKGEVYRKFPKFLQELANLSQSLVAMLSLSVNSRLNLLVDDCLLDFTNLVDVSSVLYAKDWNLFKSKPKSHLPTYDDIIEMLYPPSMDDLRKPSPIKYLQVLGALDYVLKIHDVNNLLKSQTLSQVFYYINAIVFNRIISQSKYCSRSKAIQIRLNISNLEDWLRSHNYKIYRPEKIGNISSLLGVEGIKLHNLLEENDDNKDPHSLLFYYNSLYHIGKKQLQPTIELLQWLQCMSSLTDEESLVMTINQFESLNYYQLLKVMNKLYKYEVDEKKLPKALINLVKTYVQELGEKQIEKIKLHYMTQSNFLSKEVYIYLNPNFIFNIALPNLNELITNYGSGLGGVRIYHSKLYQPTLPIPVIDDIEELLSENKANINDTFDYEEEAESSTGEAEQVEQDKETEKSTFRGDDLFKEVQMPNSLAHKNWGDDDIDVNPW